MAILICGATLIVCVLTLGKVTEITTVEEKTNYCLKFS